MKSVLIALAGISIGFAAPALAGQGYNPAGSGSSLGGGGVSDIQPDSTSNRNTSRSRPRDVETYNGDIFGRDGYRDFRPGGHY